MKPIEIILKELEKSPKTQTELKNKIGKISKREIRNLIEKHRKQRTIIKNDVPYFIISGNFGYALVPKGSEKAKRWLLRQQSQLKNMNETLQSYYKKIE